MTGYPGQRRAVLVSPLCCTAMPAAAFPDRKLIIGPHISTPQGWRHAQWNVTEPPQPPTLIKRAA